MTDASRKDVQPISNSAALLHGSPQPSPSRAGWSPARWAYSFYAVAASGAVIGQSWVALDHLPLPPAVPTAVRVLAVLPFALCLELLAMALAAMADERMRSGERAYGLRIFSTVIAAVAVGIQVAGHWPDLYWSSVFGVLSGSAYALWLLHAAARRRDALRAAGKLADTAPTTACGGGCGTPTSPPARQSWPAKAATTRTPARGARSGCTSPYAPPSWPSATRNAARP
ncbi:hypothetical protein Asp14428_32820 [Actinoplanes sp. NBRC 14428]|nr:hypothetical protein Asp14428_32820 [Actinoplanes sp. NBRC 14428]